jgi:hypothetical protein
MKYLKPTDLRGVVYTKMAKMEISEKEFTPCVLLAVDWDLCQLSKTVRTHLRKPKFCFLHPYPSFPMHLVAGA